MKRLAGEDFNRLFSTYVHTAFRLETRDHYAVSDEAEAFRRFLAGEPYDLDWHQTWLAGIRSITASGRRMQRVRLVSKPPTDYQRFELAVTPANLEAGEDIRILPRSRVAGLGLPDYDFWLFDDTLLGIMHFDADGLFQGIEMIEDSTTVAAHNAARDRAIRHAISYADYSASNQFGL
ncbi:DUF6879 family protein [Phytohabitans kaempferiae]|uniref:DUF6879 family protein n=1 Tax=Phytohabitans kaempferiae TaxID=1620943 RepID=A0ABV6M2T8_9ACTN